MAKLELKVVKDTCLGHEVYRGSAPASELYKASWIDYHDPDNNPYGYQRPFDRKRSRAAAVYANTEENAFWPECILSIRDDGEASEYPGGIQWRFQPLPDTEGRYGTLTVEYTQRTIQINGKDEPWHLAFSQVDCQHRLGSMEASSKEITFCIFPGLSRIDEAIIFRTINDKQRKISTSLVDAIVLRSGLGATTYVKWAWDLGVDVGSPFRKHVSTGGRGRDPDLEYVSLRGLSNHLTALIPRRLLKEAGTEELGYDFARTFWTAIKTLWPKQFADKKKYKLLSAPGMGGLALFGRATLKDALATQDLSDATVRRLFHDDPKRADWSKSGPLKLATGKAGDREVLNYLNETYPAR